ncbi:hypothetical protein [Haloarcula laminariae]|uniref:hypothetical protein n=1 Tax=Haloarcula laminariae TaxID=2961577 RepID=UPI0021C7343F|nr:hypothetical protein [Halomicroarcula laminariae]
MVFGLVGLVFNIVTFPGMIVNGIVQERFDESYGVPSARLAVDDDVNLDEIPDTEAALAEVSRVLDPGESPGEDERVEAFTNHGAVGQYSDLFGVVLGPFFVTTLLALCLFGGFVALQLAGIVEGTGGLAWWAGFYPGFAVAAHAFPNAEPTDALWDRSKETDSLLRFVGYPLVAVSMLFNALEFLWIDAVYAFALFGVVAAPFGLFL